MMIVGGYIFLVRLVLVGLGSVFAGLLAVFLGYAISR